MKSLKNFPAFAVLLLILIAGSCNNEQTTVTDALQYVPENATSVMSVNLKSLMQKADFEAVKQMEFYQEMVRETEQNQPVVASVLLDPEKSGIDLTQKMYVATELNKDNPEELTTYALFSLDDPSAFGKMLSATNMEVVEQNGVKMLKNGPSNAAIGWKDNMAVFALSNSSEVSTTDKLLAVFNPATHGTLASNKAANKALLQPHDFTTWMSTDAMAGNSAAKMGLHMLDLDENVLMGNSIHGYADFENGEMVGHADFFINKGLGKDFIGRFFKKEVETDFSGILPKENLAFAAVGALDVKGIDQFLSERPQTKGFADFALNDLGLKREDLVSILGGDMMVAGFDANADKPSFLMAINVKNEKKAQEFLMAAVQQKKLKEVGKNYYKVVSIGNQDFSITINKGMGKLLLKDNLLIFSADDALLEKIKEGKLSSAELVDKKILQSFQDQTLAGWFTFSALQKAMDRSVARHFDQMKFNVNAKGADFILKTSENGQNSLQTLIKVMNEAFLENKIGRQEPM
ncbi:MAG: DUF4836 family protein [Saprospiraceae bacterium]|nr:DUF4836 family protein [Saprospiraceae bacterium]